MVDDDSESSKKHWYNSSPYTNNKLKLRLRAKRAKKRLDAIAPGALSMYEFYSNKLEEHLQSFRYYQPISNEYIEVKGVARKDLDKVLDVSRITVWHWLKRNYFIEPSLLSVKKTAFYLEDEIRLLIKFMANSFYRRLPKKIEEEDLQKLHDCFLIPRCEFFNKRRL